jgi:hypothetical protein
MRGAFSCRQPAFRSAYEICAARPVRYFEKNLRLNEMGRPIRSM